jgi:hypothetical protein
MEHTTSADFLFDVRLVERHIDRGLVTREALRAHLAALQDVAAQAEQFEFAASASDDAGASRQNPVR